MRFLSLLTKLIFAIGLASCITDGESDSSRSIANGSEIPAFEVLTSDGKRFSSAELSGKLAVIVFFNTDCSDCQRELPKMQTVYEQTLDEFEWIAIGRQQDAAKAAQFWAKNSLTIPYSAQTDRKVYSLFATEGIPRVYIVDDLTIVAQLGPDKLQGSDELLKTLKAITR